VMRWSLILTKNNNHFFLNNKYNNNYSLTNQEKLHEK